MKVKFTEGSDTLTVPDGQIAERGKPIEVSDEIGKGLIAQGWSPVGGTSSHSKKVLEWASKLGVDIDTVEGTGANGNVTVKDVKAAAPKPPAEEDAEAAPESSEDEGEAAATVDDTNQGDDGATTTAGDDTASEEQ